MTVKVSRPDSELQRHPDPSPPRNIPHHRHRHNSNDNNLKMGTDEKIHHLRARSTTYPHSRDSLPRHPLSTAPKRSSSPKRTAPKVTPYRSRSNSLEGAPSKEYPEHHRDYNRSIEESTTSHQSQHTTEMDSQEHHASPPFPSSQRRQHHHYSSPTDDHDHEQHKRPRYNTRGRDGGQEAHLNEPDRNDTRRNSVEDSNTEGNDNRAEDSTADQPSARVQEDDRQEGHGHGRSGTDEEDYRDELMTDDEQDNVEDEDDFDENEDNEDELGNEEDAVNEGSMAKNEDGSESLVFSMYSSRKPLKVRSMFVDKLFKMVEDPEIQHLISWADEGDIFHVHNCIQLSADVLPKFFKHNNWQSFVRQLNMYGFHKIYRYGREETDLNRRNPETQRWQFYHPHFQRDQPHLRKNIKRKPARSMNAVTSRVAMECGKKWYFLQQVDSPRSLGGPSGEPHRSDSQDRKHRLNGQEDYFSQPDGGYPVQSHQVRHFSAQSPHYSSAQPQERKHAIGQSLNEFDLGGDERALDRLSKGDHHEPHPSQQLHPYPPHAHQQRHSLPDTHTQDRPVLHSRQHSFPNPHPSHQYSTTADSPDQHLRLRNQRIGNMQPPSSPSGGERPRLGPGDGPGGHGRPSPRMLAIHNMEAQETSSHLRSQSAPGLERRKESIQSHESIHSSPLRSPPVHAQHSPRPHVGSSHSEAHSHPRAPQNANGEPVNAPRPRSSGSPHGKSAPEVPTSQRFSHPGAPATIERHHSMPSHPHRPTTSVIAAGQPHLNAGSPTVVSGELQRAPQPPSVQMIKDLENRLGFIEDAFHSLRQFTQSLQQFQQTQDRAMQQMRDRIELLTEAALVKDVRGSAAADMTLLKRKADHVELPRRQRYEPSQGPPSGRPEGGPTEHGRFYPGHYPPDVAVHSRPHPPPPSVPGPPPYAAPVHAHAPHAHPHSQPQPGHHFQHPSGPPHSHPHHPQHPPHAQHPHPQH